MQNSTLAETNLFGIRLCAGSMSDAVDAITTQAIQGTGGLVCVANVDMLTRAKRSPRLEQVMRSATAVVTDGMPLVWALRKLKGLAHADRVYGPGLTLKLCERAAQDGIGVFLYGGTDSELAGMQARLKQDYPKLNICGAVSPPMLPAEPPYDARTVDTINQSGAGILFVGLGCPKQEFWMDAHRQQLKPIAIGVGLAFAHIAGTKQAAPRWMQRNGLEWLFRLFQEPGRLWKRYLVGNSMFVGYLVKDIFLREKS